MSGKFLMIGFAAFLIIIFIFHLLIPPPFYIFVLCNLRNNE